MHDLFSSPLAKLHQSFVQAAPFFRHVRIYYPLLANESSIVSKLPVNLFTHSRRRIVYTGQNNFLFRIIARIERQAVLGKTSLPHLIIKLSRLAFL